MNILILNGHGAGDSGALGNGYKEADLTRELADLVVSKLNTYAKVYRYPRERNAYKNNRTSQISTRYYPNFKCISIFPLQTEKQSTEILQELNKNFIIHSELSA